MNRAWLIRRGNWLLAQFSRPQTILSWAVVGGGKTRAKTVAWYQVNHSDLAPPVDPQEFLKRKLFQAQIPDAVGLLTSGNLDHYADAERTLGRHWVRCVATVGLSNALRVGDPPKVLSPVGTINLLCHLSCPLSDGALIEASTIVAEARTLTVFEADVPSTQSGLASTGTGTDCIVIAATSPQAGEPGLRYAGKHTEIGHLLGETVVAAMRTGIEKWRGRPA